MACDFLTAPILTIISFNEGKVTGINLESSFSDNIEKFPDRYRYSILLLSCGNFSRRLKLIRDNLIKDDRLLKSGNSITLLNPSSPNDVRHFNPIRKLQSAFFEALRRLMSSN